MAYAHRHGDLRACGATTVVSGQSFVTVDGQLWAVENDQNTHGAGGLIASKSYIKINGKSVIVQNDNANQDNLCPSAGGDHCNPKATGFSSLIDVS
jgi:uncharacterized Zn-binding protein involved in type VI secretion